MTDKDFIKYIPIIPKGKTITKKSSRLRKNIVHKSYASRDLYIDIHYHLLREEFTRPLGDDINKYHEILKGNPSKFGPTIFHDVTLFNPTIYHDEMVWCGRFPGYSSFQLDTKQNTGHLQDGNLACLSSDNFKNEFLPAIILEEKFTNALDVYFALKLIDWNGKAIGMEESKHFSEKKFSVIQSSSFFESCFHTLQALKESKKIPLQKYIIECKMDNYRNRLPNYFSNSQNPYKLDFSVLFNDKSTSCKLMDIRSITNQPKFGLHDAQFNALKGSLTNRLTLIQGPPGTGKTYLGCKIMKLFLHNAAKNLVPVPILVLCYTNHALDQFLVEITKFHKNKIVRVGGGCSSEKLNKFKVNELKRKLRTFDSKELFGKHYRSKDHIQKRARFLDNRESRIILPSQLTKVIPKNIMKQLNDTKIYSWLGINQLSDEIMTTCSYVLEETLLKWGRSLLQNHTPSQIINAIELNGTMDQKIIRNHLEKKSQISTTDANVHLIEDVVGDFLKTEKSTYLSIQNKCAAYVIDAHLKEKKVDRSFALSSWIKAKRDEKRKGGKQLASNPERIGEVEIIEIMRQKRARYFQTTKKNIVPMTEEELMSEDEERGISSIWAMPLHDRWRLYRTWVEKFTSLLFKEVLDNEEDFVSSSKKVSSIRDEESLKVLNNADVIAMTITGAVKYRHIVDKLNIKIVIVEEAAEVLEAHCVMALPRTTEHLILIGDHQQLRPTINVFDLARNYNLDVSLFERLIKNKIHHFQLTSQHRMRSEIADLLRLDIYKKLVDGKNVMKYEHVKGMIKQKKSKHNNLFFIQHNNEESPDDGTSKTNEHEVRFLCALCRYLIYQGYQPHEITILSAYKGQVMLFADILPSYNLHDVTSTTIDNYQGEENEIILLSLVRSNNEQNIGFLKTINRVCVALSRAKKGFYCIGDFDKIRKNANFWDKIVKHLESQNSIGKKLYLHCVKHPNYSKYAENAEDFNHFPEGGCNKDCKKKLQCGHICPRKCHPTDHKNYKCQNLCVKVFPHCNHFVRVPCFQDLKDKICNECKDTEKLSDQVSQLSLSVKKNRPRRRPRRRYVTSTASVSRLCKK